MPDAKPPPPILILGATGTLGRAVAAACEHRNLTYRLTSRSEIDLADEAGTCRFLEQAMPWAVINATGWVRVDEAEADFDSCMAANAYGAISLARSCEMLGIPTVSFSSDLVFDGSSGRPYVEEDRPAPLNVYGRSKAAMEHGIAGLPGDHIIVRTAAFFSPFDEHNFAVHTVRALAGGRHVRAAHDQVVSPTYVPHLCNAVLDLVIDAERGIWHLTNDEALSWADFATRVAHAAGFSTAMIEPVAGEDLTARAKRPLFVPLTTSRGPLLPPLDEALRQFARHTQLVK